MKIVTALPLPVLLCLQLMPAATFGEPGEFFDAFEEEIAGLFEQAGVTGTFVLSSRDGSKRFVHNGGRAGERFSPASTFKILNTLIGLETGIVASRHSTFTWDGTETSVAAWNRDQTLQSAFRVSCVWCYQEIARSVGIARYRKELAAVGFGNEIVGDSVDQFWLDGSLKISALEQVGFLRMLDAGQLPYRQEVVDELKAIMLEERTSGHLLYGKTGWTGAELHTGWYVGLVEVPDDAWFFALNLDMNVAEQAPLRKQLALRALEALEIIRR